MSLPFPMCLYTTCSTKRDLNLGWLWLEGFKSNKFVVAIRMEKRREKVISRGLKPPENCLYFVKAKIITVIKKC